MSNERPQKHLSLCMACIQQARAAGREISMLTGYCLLSLRCDGCGRTGDLAMTAEYVRGGFLTRRGE